MRDDGYVPIADYAVIGDGRTSALVSKDGSIDWLCLPNVDSGSVFGRLLDPERGGHFQLCPVERFDVERRYLPDSNVLETTFRTASGSVRLTDAMTLTDLTCIGPLREIVRKVEGLDGSVELRWRLEPRFDFGSRRTRIERRSGYPFATLGPVALALGAWDAGEPQERADGLEATFRVEAGGTAFLALTGTQGEPGILPGRADAEARLERTSRFWPDWARRARYEGRWAEEVRRGALVLKLCCFAPSGAIVAAPTTSLPEWIGGGRNWDYRFTWVRDASWTLDALLELGYHDEAHAFFWWIMHASRITQPRLQILYRIDGSAHVRERELPQLSGYRGSRPVRIGNAAAQQLQLDVYGAFLDSVWRYVEGTGDLDRDTAKEVAEIADYVAKMWRRKDSGIWEVRGDPAHFVQSKAMCWIALDRVCRLAEGGQVPDRSGRWRAEADEIRAWVDEHGWDDRRQVFVRASELDELDASVLTLALLEYDDPRGERMRSTVDAVRRELTNGPLVYRYQGEDGVAGEEGSFLTCSFWLADALARSGSVQDAVDLMDELMGYANDVGLFSEEVEPESRTLLGNFPQALSHLSFVNAAISIAEAGGVR